MYLYLIFFISITLIYIINRLANISNSPKKKLHQKMYFNDASRSKEEVLKKMCSFVELKGYVSSNYINTVLDREEVLSTEVGNKIAIPHGASSEVIESSVVLAVLKDEIEWNKTK